MARIFISYRRDDTAGHAGWLNERLSNHFGQDEVFRDINTLEPGVDFVEEIQREVSTCDVLIAMIGRNWLTVTDAAGRLRLENPEDFVRLEIGTALQRNIRVIPVLVHGATPPRAVDLPDDLKPLARRHAIELSDARWSYDVERLIEAIEKALRSMVDVVKQSSSPVPQNKQESISEPASIAVATTASSRVITPANANQLQLLRTFEGHSKRIRKISFAPNCQTIASASDDTTIRLWSVANSSPTRILEGHTSTVRSVTFSPDGRTLASSSDDKTICLWLVDHGTQSHIMRGHTDYVRDVVFSPDGNIIASASGDHRVILWHIINPFSAYVCSGHTDWVRRVSFAPDGKTLVSASADNTVRIWRVTDRIALHVFKGDTNMSTALLRVVGRAGAMDAQFAPDGLILAAAFTDNTIRLWHTNDAVSLNTFRGHTSYVTSIAFSPDGQIIASASADETVRLWSVADETMIHTLPGRTLPVYTVAFSPDGTLLASAGADKIIRLWGLPQ